MANTDIKNRMNVILDKYDLGQLSTEQVEQNLECHINALEKIPYSAIGEMRSLSYRLVRSHFNDEAEVFLNNEDNANVVQCLRIFINSLPD